MQVQNARRGRNILLSTALFAATVFAWLGVVRSASAMRMSPMDPLNGAAILTFTLGWGVMMTAMMLPSAIPMILLYGKTRERANDGVISAEMFAMTYVVIWLLTGVPVYLAWAGIGELAARSGTFSGALPYGIAGTLIASGIYQLTPAKHACLRECVSPVDFLVRRWRAGYAGSLRLAATHAAYCIGCCWALMAVLVVAGAMSLPWVLVIALVVFAEKVLPGGDVTARVTGAMLIALGLAVAIRPELAGALTPHGL